MKIAKAKFDRLNALQSLTGGNRLQFDFHAKDRDGATLEVSMKDVILHSWLESGHNGDAYGSTSVSLDEAEANAAVDVVIRRLEDKAVKNLLEEQVEEAKRARERKARSDLEVILESHIKAKKCKGCNGILSWTPSGRCCQNTKCREFRDDGTTC